MFQTRGVKASGRAPVENGQPNTVVGVTDAKLRVVSYYDERGRPTSEVLMEINGVLYAPPNSIEWCGALRQLSGQQLKLIREYEKKNAPVDIGDAGAVNFEVLPEAGEG